MYPNEWIFLNKKGVLLVKQNALQEARQMFEKALSITEDLIVLKNALYLYKFLGNNDKISELTERI